MSETRTRKKVVGRDGIALDEVCVAVSFRATLFGALCAWLHGLTIRASLGQQVLVHPRVAFAFDTANSLPEVPDAE